MEAFILTGVTSAIAVVIVTIAVLSICNLRTSRTAVIATVSVAAIIILIGVVLLLSSFRSPGDNVLRIIPILFLMSTASIVIGAAIGAFCVLAVRGWLNRRSDRTQ